MITLVFKSTGLIPATLFVRSNYFYIKYLHVRNASQCIPHMKEKRIQKEHVVIEWRNPTPPYINNQLVILHGNRTHNSRAYVIHCAAALRLDMK